jgi:hypothetical protein
MEAKKNEIFGLKAANALKVITQAMSKSNLAHSSNAAFVCSHPLVVGGSCKAAVSLWRSLPAHVRTIAPAAHPSTVLGFLEDAIFSSSADTRTAAQLACLLFYHHTSGYGTDLIQQFLVPRILVAMNGDSFQGISDKDIAIFLHPTLDDTKVEEISLADIKITNEDRKGKRGKFGNDVIEDEDWAERIKKEKAKKLSEEKNAQHSEKQAKRAIEVSEVQSRLGAVVNKTQGTSYDN